MRLKKIAAALLAAVLLAGVSACEQEPEPVEIIEPEPIVTEEPVNHDSGNLSYGDAYAFSNELVTAAVGVISEILYSYIEDLVSEYPDSFWELDQYYYPAFTDFISADRKVTSVLNEENDELYVKKTYEVVEGVEISYESPEAHIYLISYEDAGGSLVELECKWDRENDSMSYLRYVTNPDGVRTLAEAFEYVALGNNTYAIQDMCSRLWIVYADGVVQQAVLATNIDAADGTAVNDVEKESIFNDKAVTSSWPFSERDRLVTLFSYAGGAVAYELNRDTGAGREWLSDVTIIYAKEQTGEETGEDTGGETGVETDVEPPAV